MEAEYLLGLVAILVSPLYAGLYRIHDKLSNLCERMAKEETKSKIYHSEPHELEDK